MAEYKVHSNTTKLYEIIHKRLKALEIVERKEDIDIDIAVHINTKEFINIDRKNTDYDSSLAEYYINTSKESIINSLIEAKILNKKGQLKKKVIND